MTEQELVEMCCAEAYERAMRAHTDMVDMCAGDDNQLSYRQRVIVGTAILAAFTGLEDSCAGMVRTSRLIAQLGGTSVGDEVERWLAEHDGPAQ